MSPSKLPKNVNVLPKDKNTIHKSLSQQNPMLIFSSGKVYLQMMCWCNACQASFRRKNAGLIPKFLLKLL
jgi:hypothetical protein